MTNARLIDSSTLELVRLRAEADRRRAALIACGCSTYVISQRMTYQAIICLCCGLGSMNKHDVAEKFCGFCCRFHSDTFALPCKGLLSTCWKETR